MKKHIVNISTRQVKSSAYLATCCSVCLIIFTATTFAQDTSQGKRARPAKKTPAYDASVPKPALSGICYGKHERHILDFWKAESNSPTPLVFVIHGGGWKGGTKERVGRFVNVQQLLDAGISVAAINYRLISHANETGIKPPVKAPLHDAARALQFVRSKAREWNLDKQRIGAAGGSAGACSSLWLAFHDDLADPKSKDPVARESTRLWCAAVMGPQTTLDPQQMKEWTPNSKYGGHAFGKHNFAQFLAERESILPWIAEYSPYSLVSAGDPPVYLFYNNTPALGQNQKDPTHTANFGVKLQERCAAVGINCELVHPGTSVVKHKAPTDYLIKTLKGSTGASLKKDSDKRPNVLFIAIDDLRPELGCYGNTHIQSPHIDKLAFQGIVFNRAYCQFPICAVSRASLFSGMRPTTKRFDTWNNSRVDKDTPNILTLPGTFKRAGYHTVSNGKLFHHLDDTAKQSWSEPPFWLVHGDKNNNHLTFHDKESANFILEKNKRGPFFEAPDVPDNSYIDGQTCEKTIKDIRRLKKMDKPFFLACGFVRPHLPFYAPKKYWDLYKPDEIEIAENRFKPKNAPSSLRGSGEFSSYHNRNIRYNSTEFHKTARHGYYACVSYADALVGKLLATLDELGLGDNTIVVIWGDHGWHLGEHNLWAKKNLLHNATRAPLIISVPGFKRNIKTDGIVELVDIYPTLCELAGIELPKHLEGTSMVPLIRDPKRSWKKAAFIRCGNGSAVVTRDYTYTEYDKKERMLFDCRKDPEENENVAEAVEYQDTVKELSKLIAEGWKNAKPEK